MERKVIDMIKTVGLLIGALWFAYQGLESHYVVQFDTTPTAISQLPPSTPTVIPTAQPEEKSFLHTCDGFNFEQLSHYRVRD